MNKKIGIVVGSLRKDAFSLKVAKTFASLIPAGYDVVWIETAELPLFNDDLDTSGQTPASWTRLRELVPTLSGVVFVTPEFNRSIPASLKNALDIGSRPMGKNSWNGIPAQIISQSPGNIGGFGAAQDLRKVLAFLNMPTVTQPEVYLSKSMDLFAGDEMVAGTKGFLQKVADNFIKFIEQNSK